MRAFAYTMVPARATNTESDQTAAAAMSLRVELRGDEVDDRLDGGVQKLSGYDDSTAEKNDGPAQGVEPQRDPSHDGHCPNTAHDLEVTLLRERRPEALEREEETPLERGMAKSLARDHGSPSSP